MRDLVYPKLPRSTLNRYASRGTYDLQTIHEIVNSVPVVHVSFSPDADEPFPAILPMIGKMGSFDHPSADLDEPLDCYLHGYVSSRIMNTARKASETGGEGMPVCIAATKVDGVVLSLTPNSHSYNYRSAILHGFATMVTSDEEKLWAMRLITNGVLPGRYENTRVPPDKAEMDSTRILRIRIASGSGKVRHGGPHDDKKDLERKEVVATTWTGVIPTWERFGEPIAAPGNQVTPAPSYVEDYVQAMNEENRSAAIDAVKEPVKATDD